MGISFDIEGTSYDVEPYRLIMDWDDRYWHEHEHEFVGANVAGWAGLGGFNFTHLEARGTSLDLRQAFRSTYSELRAAGVAVDTRTNDRHTMLTVALGPDDTPVPFDYQYGYVYDPVTPSKLTVYIYGALMDPDDVSGQGYGIIYGNYIIDIDYNGDQQINETLTAVYLRHINNYSNLNGTDSIILGSFLGCCEPEKDIIWTWEALTGQFIPTMNLVFKASTLDQWTEIDAGLLSPPPIYPSHYYGNAPLYSLPYADPNTPIGSTIGTPGIYPTTGGANNVYGAVFLNSLYRIKVNDTLLDTDAPADSQEDNTQSHSYNDKTFYDSSDYIPDDGVPVNDALDTGFIHAYLMNSTSATSLANYMLTDSFIQGVKHLMADPIDYIISFVMLPIQPAVSGTAHILIGGVDTQISGSLINNQFMRFSCGKLKCKELWQGFPDYSPSTKVAIFLPFVGIRSLNVDDVMSGTLEVVYRIDVLTGEFICTITSDTSRALNGIIAAFNGTMGMDIPITAVNYQNKLNALTSAVSGGVSLAAGVASGNALSAIGGAAQGATGMAQAVLSKPTIERSSSLSGSSGVLGNYTPYLIIDRPVQALPKNYNALNGYSSEIGGTLSDFSGYIEVESIDLSGIACTESERAEIEALLKGGVFV